MGDKFRKSNLKHALTQVVDIIKQISQNIMQRSKVLDDCNGMMENYRAKIDRINQYKRKVK